MNFSSSTILLISQFLKCTVENKCWTPGSLKASAGVKNKCALGDLLQPWRKAGSRTHTLPFAILGINTNNSVIMGGVLYSCLWADKIVPNI